MKAHKLFAAMMAAWMIVSLLSGCAKKSDSDEIKLGALAPLTGNFAEHGKGFQTAFQMAVDEVNAAGGIHGKKVVIDFSDSEGDQKKAADLVTKYAEDQAYVGVLGGFSSGCAMAAGPICHDEGIVMLSPTASNVAFTSASEYCFSMPGISVDESKLFAMDVVSEYCQAETAYVFALNSDWGMSAMEGFRAGAAERGVTILGEDTYVSGETDYSAMITKAAAENPDVIVILDQAPGTLVNQIRTAGLTTTVLNYGAATSNEVITLCGENAEGLITQGLRLDPETEKGKAFAEEFVSRAGFDPTIYAAYAYEAARIMLDAIASCGDNVTREGVREAVAATNYDYLLGNVTFNENGNRVIDFDNSPYKISVVQNGAWVEVG